MLQKSNQEYERTCYGQQSMWKLVVGHLIY